MLDNGEIVFERETDKIRMALFSSGIMYYLILPGAQVKLDDVKKILVYVDQLGNENKYLNLYEFGLGSNVDETVRNWAADVGGNKQTIADAIVIKSLAQKIVGNFYLKFHRPVKPTKIFNNIEDASIWLLKQA